MGNKIKKGIMLLLKYLPEKYDPEQPDDEHYDSQNFDWHQ